MKTKIVDKNKIDEVASALKQGDIVAFKTDTIWGLSCLATDKKACQKLLEVKGRENKPLIILLHSKRQLNKYAKICGELTPKIIKNFWPGPLTIIFESAYNFCSEITCSKPTIAIRIPRHKLTRQILKTVGEPIVSTSANLSGKPNLNTAQEVYSVFKDKVSHIINSRNKNNKNSSTIISLTNNQLVVLREGVIKKEDFNKIL